MIHRHWLLYSILTASIALGGVAIARKVVQIHDAMAEENVRLQQMITRLRSDIDTVKREKLAALTVFRLIDKESNGDKYARGFRGDVNGIPQGPGQWKKPTWREARIRHGKPDYDIRKFEHQAELMYRELLANRGYQWITCLRDEVCRDNFTRGK